jgi:hypothetical protein
MKIKYPLHRAHHLLVWDNHEHHVLGVTNQEERAQREQDMREANSI